MSTFEVAITIDSNGLASIYSAGQCVTLIKSVSPFADFAERAALDAQSWSVAWQAFQPSTSNIVTWNDSYYLFATTTPLTLNAVVTLNSWTAEPAVQGWTYQFAQGFFTGSPGTGTAFLLANNMQGSFSFGLAQPATVSGVTGGLAPLCALPVLYNEMAQFDPSDTIAIFLSTAGSNGTVIPPVPDNALTITPTAGETLNIGFNDTTNTFYSK